MIRESIKNAQGEEVGEVIDRNEVGNEIVFISAVNINPCEIDLSYISKVYEECDGVYLIWRNSFGGWSDFLFYKAYDRKVTTKTIGEVKRYNSNRATGREDFLDIGFEAREVWELWNNKPIDSESERRELEDILYSNQVYLYTGRRFSGDLNMVLVRVVDGGLNTKENSLVPNDFKVTIELPEINTLKL